MRLLIVQDFKENRRKCTLTPLEGKPGVELVRLEHPSRSPGVVELPSGIFLQVDGPPLTRADSSLFANKTLIIVDSSWARVSKVLARIRAAEGCTLHGRSVPQAFVTAYPRTSKLYADPPSGLASVEAAFVAMLLLGELRLDLLDEYLWAREFLTRNAKVLQEIRPDVLAQAEQAYGTRFHVAP